VTLKLVTGGLLVSLGAVAMAPVGLLTLFRARRLYAWMARQIARAVLAIHGVKIRLHGEQPFPRSQTVYISNHTSTLDLFVLVALGLPNCRFFLSGFLRRLVPVGFIAWMMGTFFTVPQNHSSERTRIFKRAAATLRRTGESVYLSPEGGRIITGRIGAFNKGSFHLATALRCPIVPMYFQIPAAIDPGLGYSARPGAVTVHVLPPIDTSLWTEHEVVANKERVRDMFVTYHEERRCV
jgi:1-acyl-sn-glycerol-3-phosphate acyltransferase